MPCREHGRSKAVAGCKRGSRSCAVSASGNATPKAVENRHAWRSDDLTGSTAQSTILHSVKSMRFRIVYLYIYHFLRASNLKPLVLITSERPGSLLQACMQAPAPAKLAARHRELTVPAHSCTTHRIQNTEGSQKIMRSPSTSAAHSICIC